MGEPRGRVSPDAQFACRDTRCLPGCHRCTVRKEQRQRAGLAPSSAGCFRVLQAAATQYQYNAVFVASANRGLVPLAPVLQSAADAVTTRRQRENEERALLYVSLTRARKLAFVFGYGQMSEWF
nr:3'-5' exonuclease [Halomonas icarae]